MFHYIAARAALERRVITNMDAMKISNSSWSLLISVANTAEEIMSTTAVTSDRKQYKSQLTRMDLI